MKSGYQHAYGSMGSIEPYEMPSSCTTLVQDTLTIVIQKVPPPKRISHAGFYDSRQEVFSNLFQPRL